MSHDEDGHCFFVRQPVTAQETNAAIRSVWAGCCGAVRYGGSDAEILNRLAQLDATFQCDQQASGTYTHVVRNCAHFEYGAPKGEFSTRKLLEEIANVVAGAVRHYPDSECSTFRYSPKEASFQLGWGNSEVNPRGHSVQFNVLHESADRWALRIFYDETVRDPLLRRFFRLLRGPRPAEYADRRRVIAISVDKALQKNAAFRSVRWFAEDKGPQDREHSRPHPY